MSDVLDRGPDASAELAEPPEASSLLSEGRVLGDRYRIDRLLGRGGMGELWLAVDLKLRVEVALKSIHTHLFSGDQELELLRREVLAARQVVSPNVCRIFDLVVVGGHHLVSMEYVDGTTLLDLISERGGLDIHEASDIASQFLAGLEAIHAAGLVHRDIKPENLMVTRAGRVLVMDFGVAKETAEVTSGSVSGTPAYMAPEQARGEAVNARTDVYAAGVVLAELMCANVLTESTPRETLWRKIHHDPPEIPPGPWERVISKAVARNPGARYESAGALARALEEATLRTVQAENVIPYPGLASFTEADVAYFFGREAEVETLWKKLRRPHLHALIGPSGAGKTSFVHAGLIPAMPEGWRGIVCKPGDRPLLALVRALAPELSGDTEALRELVRFEEPKVAVDLFWRWRAGHEHALLVVDQFEELFTLNPPETQTSVAELLGRLVLEADVHVLLSMRDDFFQQCSRQPALAPVFSDVTPLEPPTGGALRRALVQPAIQCGYRFEDESMVDEMISEVEGARGCLPMLAFTVASLWDRRDRETGLLTRAAYDAIGGCAGALARHAEATLDRIPETQQNTVREIFRNLVTSQGTRASRDREELLSAFPDHPAAEATLRELIEARLLTSYELPREAGAGKAQAHHRVEIIHESLLSYWPRLVRWRTQDADGAQLRDQLRQAASAWDERGRPRELLWSGTPFRELIVWREAYPGRLTATEQAFTKTMVEQEGRKLRLRRTATASVILALLIVVAVIGLLWRSAIEGGRRAEAGELFAHGRLQLERNPSAALAYAIAGLERADEPAGRRLAVEALAGVPPATVYDGSTTSLTFSPDGRWLAADSSSAGEHHILLWSRDGGEPRDLGRGEDTSLFRFLPEALVAYQPAPGYFSDGARIRVFSLEDFRLLRSVELEGRWEISGRTLYTVAPPGTVALDTQELGQEAASRQDAHLVQAWSLDGGRPTTVARIEASGHERVGVDPAGSRLVFIRDGKLFATSLTAGKQGEERLVADPRGGIRGYEILPDGERVLVVGPGPEGASLWSLDEDSPILLQEFDAGEPVSWHVFSDDHTLLATRHMATDRLRVWKVDGGEPRVFATPWFVAQASFSPDNTWLATPSLDEATTYLYDLRSPYGTRATVLVKGSAFETYAAAFDPSSQWVATGDATGMALWPIGHSHLPRVLEASTKTRMLGVAFAPDGRWLASATPMAPREKQKIWPGVRLWPLLGEPHRVLANGSFSDIAIHPTSRWILGGRQFRRLGGAMLIPVDGSSARMLDGFQSQVSAVAFDPSGRFAAGGGGQLSPEERLIRIWDLDSGESRTLDLGDGHWITSLTFLSEQYLAAGSTAGVGIWDLESGSFERLLEEPHDFWQLASSRSGSLLAGLGVGPDYDRAGEVHIWDLESGVSSLVTSHGGSLWEVAVSPDGRWLVSGDMEGTVRLGPTSGEEPHLLLGHDGQVMDVAVSPDGQWIASSGADGSIRLWPKPEGRPLQTLELQELLERLRSLTNLRVLRDKTEPSGYRLIAEEFPGWERVPTW